MSIDLLVFRLKHMDICMGVRSENRSVVEGTYFNLSIFITFEPVHPQRFQHLRGFWRPSPSFYYSFNSR